MSHWKREFEGDITTIEERMKAGKGQELVLQNEFDFLKQIAEDYGIRYLEARPKSSRFSGFGITLHERPN